ncbi:hypothetical protein AB1Y20_005521 [Prymnesium parvum]|uniref:Glycosyl transferase CAP10 domain-containing protein n=1 Tax=Prymnesium parvum TaxID=97485 RepID=A0AB34J4E6_PRYPA
MASRRAASVFFAAGLLLLAWLWYPDTSRCQACDAELAGLRLELVRLRQQTTAELARLQAQRRPSCPLCPRCAAHAREAGGAPSLATTAAAPAPPPRQPWYWTDIIMDSLRPVEKLNGGITMDGLRLAEQKCKISTWCHRAQVIDGRLFITDVRAIFFDRHYAMARVMPILLAMKRFKVPDIDAVFSGTDYPIMEIPRDSAHMRRLYGPSRAIPPVFSPTANTVTLDLPWPDFSFFPPLANPACGKRCTHPLKTPRWQIAHPELLAIGRKVAFEDKIDRAVFTGNMKTSPNRQMIMRQAEQHPELIFANEIYIKTSPPSCFDIGEPNVTQGGVLVKRCGLSFEELCKYKYLLNVGSNGYANKLKYLFLCGSVVIWESALSSTVALHRAHVRKDSLNHEFFERHFVPGIHYAPVDTVDEIPDTIRRLQADPTFAKRIALAGQAQMATMDVDEVAHYCYRMLKAYATLQKFKPKRDPRSWEAPHGPARQTQVNCEDDLIRHYDRGSMLKDLYLQQDNSSCLRPPQPGATLSAPGWGGAYNGTHPPCLASHDLSAKEEVGVCDPGTPQFKASGRLDGPDWDSKEAYKGGATPDWSAPDPAITGKAARVIPYAQA